ncbi:hypothetical protein BDZ89DRAFT_1149449 [Hymenopellis radicata]|nr:hypothetical protein BDZ89DRAFT_1149449 [Hymenopellis radicata]
MAQHSSYSKSGKAAGPQPIDTVEMLHLAQGFLNIRLSPHQASMLIELITAATDTPQETGSADTNGASAAATSNKPAGSVFPPAYATQPLQAVQAPASISSPVGAVSATSATQAAVPAPAVVTPAAVSLPPAAVSSPPAAVSSPPAAVSSPAAAVTPPTAATAATANFPATNNGYAPYQVLPADFAYQAPAAGTPGPYYAITRGRLVGVIAGWDKASPACIGVGGAVFRSVPSLETGKQVVESALRCGSCMLLT